MNCLTLPSALSFALLTACGDGPEDAKGTTPRTRSAFAVTGRGDGDTTTVHAEVVHHGSTIATYVNARAARLT